jgi:ribonuclease D
MDYVRTTTALRALAKSVKSTPLLALDTEAAGYHRYYDRICLLQLSTRERTVLVDTLAIRDLSPLASALADPETEIVLHDAEYDLRLLARDHELSVSNLFDTKIAAQFLGEPHIGLADLTEKYLGVHLDKKHQRADWAQRPLTRELLEYAAEDTRHLPQLRDRLRDELLQRDRLDWAEEEFQLRARVRWAATEDEEAFRKLKNIRDLQPRQLAALRELYLWRQRVASDRDVAPFRIAANDVLVEVARALPENAAALGRVPRLATPVAMRHGDAFLEAVRRARALPADALPERRTPPRRPPPDPELEKRVDRLKDVRDRVADALGLDRGFLMPRQQLEDIARQAPRDLDELRASGDVREWQIAAAGEELLSALRR